MPDLYSIYDKQKRIDIKKAKALIFLVDNNRKDFPIDWKDFLNPLKREELKEKARNLFFSGNLDSLELLIKIYWVRNISGNVYRIKKNINSINQIISYEEFASHFCSALFLEIIKKESRKEGFKIYGLDCDRNLDFFNEVIDFMHQKLKPVSLDKLRLFPGETFSPHAKFIELLKYKALLKDIVVIEVEESYTSKTSFIDNEKLRVYQYKIKKEVNKELTQGNENQLSENVSKNTIKNSKIKMLGKRVNRKFISKDKVIIHADVNGSFNIVRKVLFNFEYNSKIININYELMELNLSRKVKLNNFYENSLIKNKNSKK